MLWLARHPNAEVEPLEFPAAPSGRHVMPAELDHVLDQLLGQFVRACRWHDRTTPAAVTLTDHGRQFAHELAAAR